MTRVIRKGGPEGVLNNAQIRALQRNAPTANDILENEEYLNELSKEIQNSYDQAEAIEKASADRSLPPVLKTAAKEVAPVSTFDPDAELEAELARLADAPSPAPAPEPEPELEDELDPEEARKGQIMEILRGCVDAPSEAQIEAWKTQYGKNGVNATAFGEGEAYVFTYLRRSSWQKINEVVAKAAEKQVLQSGSADIELKQKVLQHCVLYPRLTVEFFYNSRAGVLDTLFEIIMLHSYFLNAQQAMMLTTQL